MIGILEISMVSEINDVLISRVSLETVLVQFKFEFDRFTTSRRTDFLVNQSTLSKTKEMERILFADSARCSGRAHITSKLKRSLPNSQFLD